MHQSTPGAFEKNGQFYKNVEDVRAKDLVLSWNEKTNEFEYKPVVQNFIRTADKIYQLTYEDGTVIETTWSHPFYIEGKGWVKAEELHAGDVSKTDKGTLRIAKVHVDPRSEEVYNFEVAENHTYLVTDQGVVVHNANGYRPSAEFRSLILAMHDRTKTDDGLVADLINLGFNIEAELHPFISLFVAAKGQMELLSAEDELYAQDPRRLLARDIGLEQEFALSEAIYVLEEREERIHTAYSHELAIIDAKEERGEINPAKAEALRQEIFSEWNPIYDNTMDLSFRYKDQLRDLRRTLYSAEPLSNDVFEKRIINHTRATLGDERARKVKLELSRANQLVTAYESALGMDQGEIVAGLPPCMLGGLVGCIVKHGSLFTADRIERHGVTPKFLQYIKSGSERRVFMNRRPLLNQINRRTGWPGWRLKEQYFLNDQWPLNLPPEDSSNHDLVDELTKKQPY
ncbi:MAG: hypothetical protein CMN76_11435 [Spirochaetaceae bacterium]|nr:hypothetical protein [Spirochaetaceae bacterium]